MCWFIRNSKCFSHTHCIHSEGVFCLPKERRAVCSDWCKSEEAVGLERHLRGGLQQLRGENWKSARRLQQLGGESGGYPRFFQALKPLLKTRPKKRCLEFTNGDCGRSLRSRTKSKAMVHSKQPCCVKQLAAEATRTMYLYRELRKSYTRRKLHLI